MGFNEANSVRDYIRDRLAGNGWTYVSRTNLPRTDADVFVESYLIDALCRLNPAIATDPDNAEEVIRRLRAVLYSVQSDGLVRANEQFASWLRGEHSLPIGENGEHVSIRLLDLDHPERNHCVVTTEYSFTAGSVTKRMDVVLLINGIPLVIGECKTPVRKAISWVDGAIDIHDGYENTVPALFVPNLFSFGTEGKTYRFGTIRAPLTNWAPWRGAETGSTSALANTVEAAVAMLDPAILLDLLENFVVYATDRSGQKIKVIARYQQYEAANLIVERVHAGRPKKGLIWHFQGSGKSLLMVFAAQKLRHDPDLKNPTVIVVVDRIDLDTQITASFTATEIPNTVCADKAEKLETLLAQDTRKIIITTIYKFKDVKKPLNQRDNIIVLVDEAHRTQEGDLGKKMRKALPNAFLFGLTGTPINTRDRNTFNAFGAEEDEHGYLSRYTPEESLQDGVTLPIHFEPRMIRYHIDQEAIDEEFARLIDQLPEDDQAELSQRAGRKSNFIHSDQRIRDVARNIVDHYLQHVEPNGFKAMIVCYDRQVCVQYKKAIDDLLPEQMTDIVMTVPPGDPEEWRRFDRPKEELELLLDRYRDPQDPFRIVIVTAKLLAGFDAPVLQTIYLDKLMKDHTLVQACCRVNRPYANKSFGLIVDYLGVFDDVQRALTFDEGSMLRIIQNIKKLKEQFPGALAAALAYFESVDRTLTGYEGLIAAQEALPDNDTRDNFASDYSVLSRLWEAISPDPMLNAAEDDYRWLSQVYESVKPTSGRGRLLWRALGAKTIEIINKHVHVEEIQIDLEKLILDEKTITEIVKESNRIKVKEVELEITRRLQRHGNTPVFVELGEKLERLKEEYEEGFLNSLEFIRRLLSIARDVVAAEKEVEPEDMQRKAKAALTELFEEVRTSTTRSSNVASVIQTVPLSRTCRTA
ncbi:MAG: type I restriction endonuclease subunit R [Methanospirillum sp.]